MFVSIRWRSARFKSQSCRPAGGGTAPTRAHHENTPAIRPSVSMHAWYVKSKQATRLCSTVWPKCPRIVYSSASPATESIDTRLEPNFPIESLRFPSAECVWCARGAVRLVNNFSGPKWCNASVTLARRCPIVTCPVVLGPSRTPGEPSSSWPEFPSKLLGKGGCASFPGVCARLPRAHITSNQLVLVVGVAVVRFCRDWRISWPARQDEEAALSDALLVHLLHPRAAGDGGMGLRVTLPLGWMLVLRRMGWVFEIECGSLFCRSSRVLDWCRTRMMLCWCSRRWMARWLPSSREPGRFGGIRTMVRAVAM